MIGLELDSSLLDEFGLEAKVHIASIEAGLLRMEEGESDYETINGIFRAAHSIKGTASFFELNKIRAQRVTISLNLSFWPSRMTKISLSGS